MTIAEESRHSHSNQTIQPKCQQKANNEAEEDPPAQTGSNKLKRQ